LKNSEIPDISSLSVPLTESEWKSTAITATQSSNLKRQGITPHYTSSGVNVGSNESTSSKDVNGSFTTTVNPRERPKASNPLNTISNTVLTLPNTSFANASKLKSSGQPNTSPFVNKLNLQIKPTSNTSASTATTTSAASTSNIDASQTMRNRLANSNQDQFKFDDDFNSIDSQSPYLAVQDLMSKSSMQTSHSFSPSNEVILNNQEQSQLQSSKLFVPNEKKSHRRSASQ
jgi:hypothetical protein